MAWANIIRIYPAFSSVSVTDGSITVSGSQMTDNGNYLSFEIGTSSKWFTNQSATLTITCSGYKTETLSGFAGNGEVYSVYLKIKTNKLYAWTEYYNDQPKVTWYTLSATPNVGDYVFFSNGRHVQKGMNIGDGSGFSGSGPITITIVEENIIKYGAKL